MIGQFGRFEYALADRYQFERELGRGAMGVVYLAHDLRLDRHVALKMLHPALTTELGVARFQSEVHIAAKLRHPNIVPVHESGEVDGRLYFVMDYLAGKTLRALLNHEKQLSSDEALTIVADVAAALQYAHDQRVVHRDVKPENILLADGHAYLVDFGLAHVLGERDGERLTASGLSVGTPHYLSPEQASAERDVGPKADQYALACVLYEMLVGEPPFTGPTATAIAMRHIAERPPSIRQRRQSTSQNIDAAVAHALEKVPADRFHSVRAFVDAMKVPQTVEAPLARENELGTTISRRSSGGFFQNRRRIGIAALVSLLIISAAALIPRLSRHAARDPRSIVIFPLHVGTGVARDENDLGESASLLIGYRLAGAPGIQFSNAADHLVGRERTGVDELTLERKRALARSIGADRIIDGWVQRTGESLTVVLRIQSTGRPTTPIQHGVTAVAGPADAPRLALVALRELLPDFLDPGKRIDRAALEQREPAAIAAFLDGERAYRSSQFTQAFQSYAIAIQHDSLLAVAALKAAQAASWLNETSDATEYASLAARHIDLLPSRYATYANALRYYLRGDGDSAVAAARSLVTLDPQWTDAWFLLGETYFHLTPSLTDAASQVALADSAFRMAGRADSTFIPAAHHLLDLALRRGEDLRIDSLAGKVRPSLDRGEAQWLDAIVRCVHSGPQAVDWDAARRAGTTNASTWIETLVFDPTRATCARAAFAVIIQSANPPRNELWAAFVGSNASLIAAGLDEEAVRLLESPEARTVRAAALLFPDAAAGARVGLSAKRTADSVGVNFSTISTPRLWLLACWLSKDADSTSLAGIFKVVAARRDSSHGHVDSLVASVTGAHLAATRHDTTAALQILRTLSPAAPHADLMWQPWEGLAGERVLEASLLAGRGQYADAIRAAGRIDAQTAMTNLVYLRQSLRLRESWALRLGDTSAAAGYRRQQASWSAPAK